MAVYQNPVIAGYYPDPSVCRVGEDFYLVASSFEFFPGVPVFHSRNLVNWEPVGHCLSRESQLNLHGCRPSGGIYAPTIRYNEGTFFMTTTNTTGGGNFIVHTKDVRGEWSEPAWVDQAGIDPSLLFDDGHVYFCSNGGAAPEDPMGIYLCEVDPFTGRRLTPSVLISRGCGGKHPEAPHLYHIGEFYYLMLAEGGTEYGHMITMQRSRGIYGPYEACPWNPILSNKDAQGHPIQATGHGDLFADANGRWWMVCLGIRPFTHALLHNIGRETFLAPVIWRDGWPVAGSAAVSGKACTGHMELSFDAQLPAPSHAQSFDFADSFEGENGGEIAGEKEIKNVGENERENKGENGIEKPGPYWTFLRNPDFSQFTWGNGELVISGGAEPLSSPNGQPSFTGVRQRAVRAAAEVTARLEGASGRCGLSAFYNQDYHYEIYLEREHGQSFLRLNRRIADLEAVTASVSVCSEAIRLRIEADEHAYVFLYKEAGGYGGSGENDKTGKHDGVGGHDETGKHDGIDKSWKELGRGLAAGLCTEGTHSMTFTGTFFGLFAQNGTGHFSDFSVKNFQ